MKKFIVPAMFALAIGFTSCSAEAVVEAIEEASCSPVVASYEAALKSYNEEASETNCEALKAAIEAVQDLNCASEVELVEVPNCG